MAVSARLWYPIPGPGPDTRARGAELPILSAYMDIRLGLLTAMPATFFVLSSAPVLQKR